MTAHAGTCPAAFQFIWESHADYVAHTKIENDQLPTCLFSSSTIYLCGADNVPKWNRSWLDIYNVEATGENQLSISTVNTKGNPKNPLMQKTITFANRNQRDLWVIVCRRLSTNSAQQYFESNWLKEPEIYQLHRFCLKYTTKGKRIQTLVALSMKKLYMFTTQGKNSTEVKELIGSCSLSLITSFFAFENCKELIAINIAPSSASVTGKLETQIILRFFTSNDSLWFIQELARLYYMVNQKPLEEEVKTLSRVDSIKEAIRAGFD